MEKINVTKLKIQDWFFKNKLNNRLSHKKESIFWNDFLAYPPMDNRYYETKKYFFYYFSFWTLCEVRYWKQSGRVSITENRKKFTLNGKK